MKISFPLFLLCLASLVSFGQAQISNPLWYTETFHLTLRENGGELVEDYYFTPDNLSRDDGELRIIYTLNISDEGAIVHIAQERPHQPTLSYSKPATRGLGLLLPRTSPLHPCNQPDDWECELLEETELELANTSRQAEHWRMAGIDIWVDSDLQVVLKVDSEDYTLEVITLELGDEDL